MKSLPRPWYLTKCRNPLSLRSRKEVWEPFSRASILMEVAETRKLGFRKATVSNVRKLGWTEEEDEEEEGETLREVIERRVTEWRVGEVRGREMVAAMAMALRFSLCVYLGLVKATMVVRAKRSYQSRVMGWAGPWPKAQLVIFL